ncbi:MAG TPA: sugar phosphate isomerase/epimerase family protein [Candidatus Dormibacteraeota bacterium]
MSAGLSWEQVSAFGDEVELEIEEQLEALAELGIRHLELRSAGGEPVDLLDADQLARCRTALANTGFDVSAIASPVGKSTLDAPREESAEQLRRCFHAAAALDSKLVRIFSFYVEAGELDAVRGEVHERVGDLAHLAADAGLTLLLENERGVYGERPERLRELVDTVRSPALQVCFDPANFVQAGCDAYPAWELLRDDVAHVHVKDALPNGDVTVAGSGAGAWPEILADLTAHDYRGWLTLEPHLHFVLEGDGRTRLRAAAEALKALLG